MSLEVKIMDHMKEAMKAKDTVALEALRAIKSEILLAQTASGSKEEISEADEIKILQKLVKMLRLLFLQLLKLKMTSNYFLEKKIIFLLHLKKGILFGQK